MPPRSGGDVLELEVLDVDPLGAERLGDRGEHAGPVGHVDANPVERAGVGVGAARASAGGSGAASPIQRARKPASPCSSAASTCSIRRRCSASASRIASRVVEEDVDPDARVRAGDAGHVAQRAAGVRERLVALDAAAPAWLTTTFASTCGTWLVIATSRSCASASIATGDAPSSATNPCTSAVALGVGLRRRASGTTSRPSKSAGVGVLGAARLGAADRVAADEARRAAGGARRRSPWSSRRR